MEKHTKKKPKQIDYQKIDNSDSDNDDDTLSSHSKLSIDPNEPLVNDIAHNLYILAIKKAREERRQAKTRQKTNKKTPTLIERQTILMKKKKLIIDDIDRLFEEKRLRPKTIKNDLVELYQKSTGRVRSMLDIRQIDQFIQAKQNRTR